ncbi:MAG: class I SAM-dependent methyltransferase [Bacteroidota bacterium]
MVSKTKKIQSQLITSFQRFAWKYLLPKDIVDEMHEAAAGFDEKHGTQTNGVETIVTGNDKFQYYAVPQQFAHTIFEGLGIRYESYSFIDIGSGKGRIAMIASSFPFKKVVGVELLPQFHQIAQSNFQKYQVQNQLAAPVDFICMDAIDYTAQLQLDSDAIFFFFHPFQANTLKKFLDQVQKNDRDGQHNILLVYCGGMGMSFGGFDEYLPVLNESFHCLDIRLVGKTPKLTTADIKDFVKLAPGRWLKGSKLSQEIWKQFPEDIKKAIKSYEQDANQVTTILRYLNDLIELPLFYKHLQEKNLLSKALSKWGAQVSKMEDRKALNRLVLNEAFPNAIRFYLTIPVAVHSNQSTQ